MKKIILNDDQRVFYIRLLRTIQAKETELREQYGLRLCDHTEISRAVGKRDAENISKLRTELSRCTKLNIKKIVFVGGESILGMVEAKNMPGTFYAAKIALNEYNKKDLCEWHTFSFKRQPNPMRVRFVEGIQAQDYIHRELQRRNFTMGKVPSVIQLSDQAPVYTLLEWIDGQNFGQFCMSTDLYFRANTYYYFLQLLEQVHKIKLKDHGPVVHRDIGPNNIMVDNNYTPWLIDFSLVKPLDAASARDEITLQSANMGNPMWVAPEQLTGQAKYVDWRADQYAAAAMIPLVFLQMKPPGRFAMREQFISRMETHLMAPVWRVYHRATQWEPDRRYKTTGEFVRDFKNACLLTGIKLVAPAEMPLSATKTEIINTCPVEDGKCGHVEKLGDALRAESREIKEKLNKILSMFDVLGGK